ncbi:hypothetical protein OG257_22165 [Streptomyces sp. NBC_00683]|uniref:hypothetical protein n=1 Tax=Streptomyces sp. NBC_00683 TaxID=2903670 RepID=UPI002E37E47E|nr:hypothetical protein [Streptomyces sp. NBC_00683]
MTYRRAAIPALAGGLLLTALLWWAGASVNALHLAGTTEVLGGRAAAELEHWLAPWSYDAPASLRYNAEATGGAGGAAATDGSRYLSLYATSMQIRFGVLFAVFMPGALLLVRRLPPVRGRTTAAFLAVWAWGLVAGMLAATVSAPWQIASRGHGSYRFLPQLAGSSSSGQQITVFAALVAAAATVLAARITTKGAGPLPLRQVPARAARLAATVGTAVVALSLLVLSYQPVAASIQTVSLSGRLLAEPGEFLRTWLLLGGWAGPAGAPLGTWLLYRVADALLLAVVWWSLRKLPVLLAPATVPAMAAGAVCATVIGLLARQLLQMALTGADSGMRWGLVQLSGGLGGGVPAALTWGLVAGLLTALTLRLAGGGAEADDAPAPALPDPPATAPAPPTALPDRSAG